MRERYDLRRRLLTTSFVVNSTRSGFGERTVLFKIILVVDDERDMAEFATTTLESHGYSVGSVRAPSCIPRARFGQAGFFRRGHA